MATIDLDGRDRVDGPRGPLRRPPEPMSLGRASLIGACAGLGTVALFVAGVRTAYRAASPPASVTHAQAMHATPVGSSTKRPADPMAKAPPAADESPVASAASPAIAQATAVRATDAAASDAALPSAVAALRAPTAPPAWHRAGPPPARRGPAGVKQPSPASGASPDDDTSQTSLVPVIPDSPPPAVDPLVKAVQELEPSAPSHLP